mmetsp:Transcript_6122/g.7116  ORF Transcript_6122/g.7116 Transcript_6122/m.7116 type:complete len:362 (+) Transcript_6122:73-1158(+)
MAQQCLPLPRRRKRNDAGAKAEEPIPDLSTMDAMAYMASVNLEASLLPDVFVASPTTRSLGQRRAQNWDDVPIDGSAAASQYLLSNKMHITPPPTQKHLPRYSVKEGKNIRSVNGDLTKDEWISSTLSNFSSLRVYIKQCHESGIGRSSKSYNRMPVPMSKDQVGWHTFCLGWDEARGNVGGYFQDDDSDERDDESISNINDGSDDNGSKNISVQNGSTVEAIVTSKTWDISTVPTTGHKPCTTLLCQFDQIIIRRVLSHHAYYLSQDWDFTESRGRWIYALLSRLEKPLHWNETSMLRGLLRNLCQLRADMDLDERLGIQKDLVRSKTLSILNVLIVVMGVYFEQGGGADYLMDVNTKPS